MRQTALEIKKTNNLLQRYAESRVSELLDNELTGMQGHAMGYIYKRTVEEGKDTYQKDVEQRFSIRRSTATVMLQSLERKGYITKRAVKHDARLKKLVVTDKGLAAHSQIYPLFGEIEQSVSRGIAPDDLEAFFRVIDTITKNIKENMGEAADK